MSDNDKKDAEVIKADYDLQGKIGSGPLDEAVIKNCERVVETNSVDFAPLADEFLGLLQQAIKDVSTGKKAGQDAKEALTQPVMQLKANAAMFKYNLIGNLANVMLSFLESVEEMDDDVVAILGAHHSTLHAIVLQKVTGDGGANGKQLETELKDACKRYFKKRAKS